LHGGPHTPVRRCSCWFAHLCALLITVVRTPPCARWCSAPEKVLVVDDDLRFGEAPKLHAPGCASATGVAPSACSAFRAPVPSPRSPEGPSARPGETPARSAVRTTQQRSMRGCIFGDAARGDRRPVPSAPCPEKAPPHAVSRRRPHEPQRNAPSNAACRATVLRPETESRQEDRPAAVDAPEPPC